ncbi:MAG: disulfide bond formation protein DsbA [Oceanospirillaceae bacterium]|nr:disulfide bond formation protein DsbA [Oceanospirillaceae bacterium]MAY01313.1 disulfide bond formation protein DsbA [Oceanospirillaceae bacterium]MBL74094.1 disulfide bond formation protein DsbA [Idiomarinaceae bacterium]MBS51423.1 disulfide bond formation protein DsbA [Oceanospirillaceae bacterium]|tara:strand:- start:2930 stop:3523 length:594 start_codon:yes stop_codon:yes gene_type:complete
MKTVDFYYDYGSPASYIACTQIEKLCAKYGANVVFKPFVLGAVFKTTGNSSPIVLPTKARYTMMDFTRWAKYWGVPFTLNQNFPINTILHMKLCVAVQLHHPQHFAEFNTAMFNAMWVENQNLTEPAVVAAICESVGLDANHLLMQTEQDDVRNALRGNTDEAIALGAFGAPTMMYNGEMFFGQDRLPMLELALQEG